jgi:spore germination protein GerM
MSAAALAAWLAISEAIAMSVAAVVAAEAASETSFRTALNRVMEGPSGEVIVLMICRVVFEITDELVR